MDIGTKKQKNKKTKKTFFGSLVFPFFRISVFPFFCSRYAGVAALPTILMIGGLISEIIIGLTAISYVFVNSEFGAKLSSDALAAANAGVQDALIKIVRDKNFTEATTTLAVGNYSADVSVCKDLPCYAIGRQKIISIGKAQTRRRGLRAVVDVDAVTGEVRLESLNEIQL